MLAEVAEHWCAVNPVSHVSSTRNSLLLLDPALRGKGATYAVSTLTGHETVHIHLSIVNIALAHHCVNT